MSDDIIKQAEEWAEQVHSASLRETIATLTAQLTERDAEIKDLRQIITTYSDQEGENAALRAEVDRLGFACEQAHAEAFDSARQDARKQAAREIVEMICSDQYVRGLHELMPAIKSKFGLEG